MEILSGLKVALYAFATGTMLYLNIQQEQMTILALLMALDFITGFIKSYNCGTTSSKAGIKGFFKKAIVIILPFGFGMFARGMGYNPDAMMSVMFSGLITYEFLSVLSNVYTVQTGIELPERDIVTKVIKLLYNVAGGAADRLLGSDKTSAFPEPKEEVKPEEKK